MQPINTEARYYVLTCTDAPLSVPFFAQTLTEAKRKSKDVVKRFYRDMYNLKVEDTVVFDQWGERTTGVVVDNRQRDALTLVARLKDSRGYGAERTFLLNFV
jgi:hypothetical protein